MPDNHSGQNVIQPMEERAIALFPGGGELDAVRTCNSNATSPPYSSHTFTTICTKCLHVHTGKEPVIIHIAACALVSFPNHWCGLGRRLLASSPPGFVSEDGVDEEKSEQAIVWYGQQFQGDNGGVRHAPTGIHLRILLPYRTGITDRACQSIQLYYHNHLGYILPASLLSISAGYHHH